MKVKDIQEKFDSPKKLQAVAGIDPKYVLFAPEFNALVDVLKLIITRQFASNSDALAAGLVDGDIYHLPVDHDNYVLAVAIEPPMLTLTDSNGDVFGNIIDANKYVQYFTDAVISNESFANGVYRFSVPFGSNFDLNPNFCAALLAGQEGSQDGRNLEFVDLKGAVVSFKYERAFAGNSKNNVIGNAFFGGSAFAGSDGNNTFGNCEFGDNSFVEASGNNTFGNTNAGDNFFAAANGTNSFKDIKTAGGAFIGTAGIYRFENSWFEGKAFVKAMGTYYFNGNIGGDEKANCGEAFFTGNVNAKIHALASKQTSNGGTVEGDIATAQSYNATVFFDL